MLNYCPKLNYHPCCPMLNYCPKLNYHTCCPMLNCCPMPNYCPKLNYHPCCPMLNCPCCPELNCCPRLNYKYTVMHQANFHTWRWYVCLSYDAKLIKIQFKNSVCILEHFKTKS